MSKWKCKQPLLRKSEEYYLILKLFSFQIAYSTILHYDANF